MRAQNAQELKRLQGETRALLTSLIEGDPRRHKYQRLRARFDERRLALRAQACSIDEARRVASHRFAQALREALVNGASSSSPTSLDESQSLDALASLSSRSSATRDARLSLRSSARLKLEEGSRRPLSRLFKSTSWIRHAHNWYLEGLVRTLLWGTRLTLGEDASPSDQPEGHLVSYAPHDQDVGRQLERELEWSSERFIKCWEQVMNAQRADLSAHRAHTTRRPDPRPERLPR